MAYLLWPFLCLCVCFPLKELFQGKKPVISVVFKSLGTLCATGLALSFGMPEGSGWWCVTGLVLCAAADALLGVHFIAGMAVFALGHICYILWFISLQSMTWLSAALLLALLAFAGAVIHRFRNKLGNLKLPFCAYAIILCAMGALGIPCGVWTAAAAILFIISDTMVCRVVLMPVSRTFDLAALGLYYAAQLLFGAACTLL